MRNGGRERGGERQNGAGRGRKKQETRGAHTFFPCLHAQADSESDGERESGRGKEGQRERKRDAQPDRRREGERREGAG